jgi:hypothetical protein
MDQEIRRACNQPTEVLKVFIQNWSDEALTFAYSCLKNDIVSVERELALRKAVGSGGSMQNLLDERYLVLVSKNLASIGEEIDSRRQ